MPEKIAVKIRRQKDSTSLPYWEEFLIDSRPHLNVTTLLMEIQRNPVNAQGEKTTPVSWQCSCLEDVCGSCTMVINGRVRQSCIALVDQLEKPIILEPMRKFPVVRDLVINRSRMFEALRKVHAWIDIDGTYDLGPAPRQSPNIQQLRYIFSQCMTCGCCVDACPQYNSNTAFIGASALGQVFLFNTHPIGSYNQEERLHAVMGEGGIQECGNAQNCVQVCPKEIPLTSAIAQLNRETVKQAVKDLLFK